VKSFLKKILHEDSIKKLNKYRFFLTKINPFISWRYIYLDKGKCFDIFRFKAKEVLPNFILIGAQRCGTTSMHSYLKKHPDIFMSQPLKEPGFFLDTAFIKNYLASYGIHFDSKDSLLKNFMLQGYSGEKFFGESSTHYTWGDRSRTFKTPQRMKMLNPEMKLIYIIRNPFARMVSHFLGVQNKFQYVKLNHFVYNNSWVLANSLYYYQLKYYLEFFTAKQIKIIVFEDYINDPQKILNEIFDHLNVKKYQNYSSFKIMNQSENRNLLPEKELKFTLQNYEKLIEPIRTDISEMEKFLHRSLSLWDISPEKWCV
jgi:hypothetical protein